MLHGPKRTQQVARRLRREMTLPEVLLWQALRARPGGLRFRRQHPAGPFVLDFFCAAHRLAVEVDGEAHGRGDRPVRDGARDAWLSANGVRVLRIPARDVLTDLDAVVRHIVESLRGNLPLHHAAHGPPPPPGGGLRKAYRTTRVTCPILRPGRASRLP
ncbi:endonuclease domain-containing protein [Sphingomonas sp. Y38-1Y]|uniref:endonuclease domain-containing protein n=1 Tax=Sphingomonas sp. Y38-1Y TaxID=3078265 RepID=UPI0028EAC404|nr:endonuclease domain-containing protein [Sphingomonas sp. Y38-1Y]